MSNHGWLWSQTTLLRRLRKRRSQGNGWNLCEPGRNLCSVGRLVPHDATSKGHLSHYQLRCTAKAQTRSYSHQYIPWRAGGGARCCRRYSFRCHWRARYGRVRKGKVKVVCAIQFKRLQNLMHRTYQQEQEYFFQDWSAKPIKDQDLQALMGNNNVVLTAHQAFFTNEAIDKIVETTLENIRLFHQEKKTLSTHPNSV